jgi:hypothetical protein
LRDPAPSVIIRAMTWLRPATAAVAVLGLTACAGTSPSRPSVPRLADGRPDLNGVWSYATLTPVERPKELGDKATLTAAEAEAYEKRTLEVQNRDRRDGDGPDGRGSDGRTDLDRAYNQFWWDFGTRVVATRQTSLVVDPPDGRIPALTEAARQRVAERAALRNRPPEGPEDRSLAERCLNVGTAGPPMLPGPYNNNVQLVQGTTHLAIHNEMIHDTRLVPLDGRPHLVAGVRQWLGDSRGHWEGDTLVVETRNFRADTAFRGASDQLYLVERFTRVSEEALHYEFTVSDSSTWARPWSVSLPMTRSREPIYEYACHEGNYGLATILAGARSDEKK